MPEVKLSKSEETLSRPSISSAIGPGAEASSVQAATDDRGRASELQGWRSWCTRDTASFFVLGIMIALPCMLITTGANDMFTGITGVYGISMSLAAALTSFITPLLLHRIHHDARVLVALTASVLSFIICTLGHSVAGPIIGTILSGFVYAFGTNCYLAVAAFYDSRTVIAFSAGSGCSAIIGPGLYIGLVEAFSGDWRKALLVSLPFPFIQPAVWWLQLSRGPRTIAEQTRRMTLARVKKSSATSSESGDSDDREDIERQSQASISEKAGFSPEQSRLSLFARDLLPSYVVPLFCCTLGAMFNLSGLSPTFQELNTFKSAPSGRLNYQIDFLAYGAAQFLFSSCAGFYKMTFIYGWAALMLIVLAIGIVQLWAPFLTYYGVWVLFMFITGGVVGGSVTNTNYKVAEDFRRRGASDEVRSFAMSYGGLGNFSGDTIGGALAIVLQKLATQNLPVRTH